MKHLFFLYTILFVSFSCYSMDDKSIKLSEDTVNTIKIHNKQWTCVIATHSTKNGIAIQNIGGKTIKSLTLLMNNQEQSYLSIKRKKGKTFATIKINITPNDQSITIHKKGNISVVRNHD